MSPASPAPGRGRLSLLGLGVVLALAASALAPLARADTPAAAPPADPCPAAVPLSTVRAGMTGEGLTVVRGTEPQSFSVEVLGVLKDGIGAGRDLIMIEASDLPGQHVVDAGGGIWAGMSGSPVYVDGQLLGAVSYGFTAAPSPIGGLTPAADMLDLLDLAGASARKADRSREQTTVRLSAATRSRLDARADATVPRTLRRLPAPLSVSGLTSDRLARFQRDADAAKLPVIAYAGSSAAAPAPRPTAVPKPGGNFAAALAYGDLTAAATGTTTAVCGDQAVAFGHPFNLAGPVRYGANDATSLAIVKDNSFGSFKMSNLGASFGTVDQDRLAGIRADLTISPSTAEVSSTVTNLDTGRQRTGTTRVVDPTLLPAITFYSLLANYDSTFDEVGDGRATGDWTITGTRAHGKALVVRRANRFASQEDVSTDPAFEVANAVDQLVNNEIEPVTISSIRFSSSVATQFRQSRVTSIAVVQGGKWVTPKVLRVKPGATFKVRTGLRPYGSTTTSYAYTMVTVPARTSGQAGELSTTGGVDLAGGPDEENSDCLITGNCEADTPATLDQVIRTITSAPRNDDLVVGLSLESDTGKVTRVNKRTRVYPTVAGQRTIAVAVG